MGRAYSGQQECERLGEADDPESASTWSPPGDGINVIHRDTHREVPEWVNQSHLRELEVRAQNTAMRITKQIEEAKTGKFKDCESERVQEAFEVLNFEKIT